MKEKERYFKITWNENKLKIKGYTTYDLFDCLEAYGAVLTYQNEKVLYAKTVRTQKELLNKLIETYNIKFSVSQVLPAGEFFY